MGTTSKRRDQFGVCTRPSSQLRLLLFLSVRMIWTYLLSAFQSDRFIPVISETWFGHRDVYREGASGFEQPCRINAMRAGLDNCLRERSVRRTGLVNIT